MAPRRITISSVRAPSCGGIVIDGSAGGGGFETRCKDSADRFDDATCRIIRSRLGSRRAKSPSNRPRTGGLQWIAGQITVPFAVRMLVLVAQGIDTQYSTA